MISFKYTLYSVVFLAFGLASCTKNPNNPGLEYAPQMYVSKAYDPYSQVVDANGKTTMNAYNPFGINMRDPAKNTISRRNYKTVYKDSLGVVTEDLMIYNIHKDSILIAEKTLKNPIPLSPAVLEEGKALYIRFCIHCHGEKGDGQGKVGVVYKGVPNYSAITKNNGHIFHVITHGKNRMWAHSSQISPEERWKIVHYVNQLQGGPEEVKVEKKEEKTEKKEVKAEDKAIAKK